MKIKIQKQEYWYGGCAAWGTEMPFGEKSEGCLDFAPNQTPNQSMPLLLSSKGRVLWLDGCDRVIISNGMMECSDAAVLKETGGSLRDAYLASSNSYFKPSGRMPAKELFQNPIFNTWIELTFYQSQQAVLRYAEGILQSGFEPGVLMIDDGWSECYGCWKFHSGKFPDPQSMLQTLHQNGFKVMLWVCPYLTPDSIAFREARDQDLLLKTQAGTPFVADWWNGYSAALDLSNPRACAWLDDQLAELVKLGVDGFKFDGGDALHYVNAYSGKTPVEPNEMCRLWTEFGKKYAFNEYRASWKAGNAPLLQRLCDKDHSWGKKGMQALIPDTLAQGIIGHAFGCADMVGGGEYRNFAENAQTLDKELFVKHSAAGCLLPSIQFSAAPWRILNKEELHTIQNQMALRKTLWVELEKLLQNAAQTGEPVVRYMEYEFPNQGCETITDQFMLGSELLAAPILEKGQSERSVYVPKGVWSFEQKTIQSRGQRFTLAAPKTFVVLLKRLES